MTIKNNKNIRQISNKIILQKSDNLVATVGSYFLSGEKNDVIALSWFQASSFPVSTILVVRTQSR
jgi:hypothetical protein